MSIPILGSKKLWYRYIGRYIQYIKSISRYIYTTYIYIYCIYRIYTNTQFFAMTPQMWLSNTCDKDKSWRQNILVSYLIWSYFICRGTTHQIQRKAVIWQLVNAIYWRAESPFKLLPAEEAGQLGRGLPIHLSTCTQRTGPAAKQWWCKKTYRWGTNTGSAGSD